MPNPPFQPLTLSVEEWNADEYPCVIPKSEMERAARMRAEAEAQAQEAASLRQRLEEAEKRIEQLEKTLTASHMTDLSARLRDVLSDETLEKIHAEAERAAEAAYYDGEFNRGNRDAARLNSWRESILPLVLSLQEEQRQVTLTHVEEYERNAAEYMREAASRLAEGTSAQKESDHRSGDAAMLDGANQRESAVARLSGDKPGRIPPARVPPASPAATSTHIWDTHRPGCICGACLPGRIDD